MISVSPSHIAHRHEYCVYAWADNRGANMYIGQTSQTRLSRTSYSGGKDLVLYDTTHLEVTLPDDGNIWLEETEMRVYRL